ncbi:TetR/AcrR family transcriptional regulator [Candidatus Sodalis endolongispinus]|uniref:TetR/AcrR family transcriptional regulator n=1 Tax=Candidatus Sodalis endolongispinus TaxID=2812662 RepID=A0ABS5Y811_9GAMM|nr:TetR/AcrR family transcriptional regulator [Candidatus Sodalis endolongispinus]MBT9431142.1 TetR/AcrR family transcriptional regulator [Candidatus Sodalis endolongispinus]
MKTESVTVARRGRGRPKKFCREEALDKALELFWRHGFDATSLVDLVDATGAKAPTLYGEFGNKEGLFCAVMDLYVVKFSAAARERLSLPGLTTLQALENFFRAAAALYTDKNLPTGCFIICTSSTLAASSQAVEERLRAHHHLQEQTLLAFLQRQQQQGQLAGVADCGRLAKYLTCTLRGMSVQARDGAGREDLDAIVTTLLAQWPQLVENA